MSTGNRNQVEIAIKDHKIMESSPAILMLLNPQLKHQALYIILMLLKTTGNDLENIYAKDIEEANLIEIVKKLAGESEFSRKARLILEFFPTNQIEEGYWGG